MCYTDGNGRDGAPGSRALSQLCSVAEGWCGSLGLYFPGVPPPSVGCTEMLAFLFSGRMGKVPHQQGNVEASMAWMGLRALTGQC